MFRAVSVMNFIFCAWLRWSRVLLAACACLLAASLAGQPKNLVEGPAGGGIYTYVYVTQSEVRCELLMPMATLERWVPVPRAAPEVLSVGEQEAMRPLLEEFFKTANPVDIDGLRVTPVLARYDFGLIDARDPGEARELAPVAVEGAWVGIILSFNTAGAPVNMRLKWTMFDESLQTVGAQIHAFDQQTQAIFRAESPVYEWSGLQRKPPKLTELQPEPERLSHRVPVLSVVCLAMGGGLAWRGWRRKTPGWPRQAGLWCVVALGLAPALPMRLPAFFAVYPAITQSEASEVFSTLHRNVYRAFDYRTESDIYDALARSASGDLLRTLYGSIRRDLEFEEQGRAVSRVSDVRIEAGALVPPAPGEARNSMRSFRYDATWTLSGVVGHWGHSHERTNRYHAIFTVEVVEGAWKITQIEVLKEERLEIRFLS